MDLNLGYHFNIPALMLSTFLSILTVHSSIIEKPIFKWLNKKTAKENDLLEQRSLLKNEQASINMVDEFAKYSKIQRRINSLDEQLAQIQGSKPTNNIIVQLGFTYGVKFVLVLLLIFLSLYYRYTPVIYLGSKISLIPFTSLICYPNAVNQVSFYFWSMCSASVARLMKA